jgi:hypothetical protein
MDVEMNEIRCSAAHRSLPRFHRARRILPGGEYTASRMASAYKALGVFALVAGVAALVLQASGQWAHSSQGACFSYLFGAFLALSGVILIRGAPERAAAKAAPSPDLQEIGPEIEALVRGGDVIEAINRHRGHFGSSLKDAKDAIDAVRERLRQSGEI